MTEKSTINDLLIQCVGELNEPFRRADIMNWFRKNHPEIHLPSLSANIQGVVSNIPIGRRGAFQRHTPVITREAHGVYRRFDPAAPELLDTSDPRWVLFADAISAVEPGFWTSYDDLAEVSGVSTQSIGDFLRETEMSGAHRALSRKGLVPGGFRWSDPDRDTNPLDLLAAEGVQFDASGRALENQRVGAAELREILGLSPEAVVGARRAWLVRGSNVNGRDLVSIWLAKGSCSIAATQLRPVEPPLSRRDIAALVEEDYAHVSYNARNEKTSEFDVFLNRVQIDDLVVTTSKGDVFVGTVTGEVTYIKSNDGRSNLRRTVEWANPDDAIDFSTLPSALTARLASQHTVVDLTVDLPSVERLLASRSEVEVPDEVAAAEPVEATLRDATPELANDLLVSQDWLQECIELLRDRQQLIFYGPPGTGKTYLAQKLAKHVTSSGSGAVKLVQFHPSYSYEDFFEGYRPSSGDDGQVGFTLSPGPFRRLVDTAIENKSTAYVLIIDEINRANLAKVFGELYFLLEYRDEAIDLLYATGDDTGFTLPSNVFIIGTMNTADRSIALVDAAMRRRFAFLPLHPNEEPTAGLLERWLDRNGHPPTNARLLDALNARIEDADFKIGPSYFMRDSVYVAGGRERMWRTAILPLLEEHHYGDSVDVRKRYDLTRLMRLIDVAESASSDDGPNEHDEATATLDT